MKFKKSTALLVASALILGTGVFIYEVTIAPQLERDQLARQKVFNFEMDQVKSLTVETPERTLNFVPVETKPESGERQWEMTVLQSSTKSEINGRKPIPANEAYVSFLLSLLMNAKSDREIPVSDALKVEYGLDKPQATIDFTLKNENKYELILGKRDFSDTFLYAIANPSADPNAKLSAILLPINFENGVNRPLSEWKADSETTDKKITTEPETPSQDAPKKDEPSEVEPTPTPQPYVKSNSEEKSTTPTQSQGEKSEPSPLPVPTETTESEKIETPSSTPPAEPKTPEPPLDVNVPVNRDGTTPAPQPYPEPKPYVRSENPEE